MSAAPVTNRKSLPDAGRQPSSESNNGWLTSQSARGEYL